MLLSLPSHRQAHLGHAAHAYLNCSFRHSRLSNIMAKHNLANSYMSFSFSYFDTGLMHATFTSPTYISGVTAGSLMWRCTLRSHIRLDTAHEVSLN